MHHHIIMCGVLGGFSGAFNTYSITKSIYRCFEILRCTTVDPTSSYSNIFLEKLDYEKDMRNYRFTYYRNFNDLRGMFIWISRLNLALDPVPSMLIVTTQ